LRYPQTGGVGTCIEEVYRPSNGLLWILGPNDGTSDDVLAEVNEMIERAPTPFGNFNFIIVVERRASLLTRRWLIYLLIMLKQPGATYTGRRNGIA
jgi:hypothetical protein